MLHVLGCITQQHDLRLVALAAVLCLLACVTAMSMIARGLAAGDFARTLWLGLGGVVAGGGIWALHFIAMLAYDAGLPVTYDLPRTLLSAVIAAVLSGVGFRIAATRLGPAIGGCVTGLAISAMHYVGMSAVIIPARPVWNIEFVAASLLLGVVASSLALCVAIRINAFRGYAFGAAIFLIAIVGMHFTGMSAVAFVPDPTVPFGGTVIEPDILAVAIASVAVLMMALGLIGAIIDRQLSLRASSEAARLRAHVLALEKTQQQLEGATVELKSALSAADAASRAKSNFLASMSHELRTPLNAVIGFSEVLATESFGPIGNKRYREYAQDIQSSGQHLLLLINDILDLSRLDAGKADIYEEQIGISDLLSSVLRMIHNQAVKADVRIETRVATNVSGIRADKRRMHQILINLLSNACKFTPAKGDIAVDVFCAGSELAIAVKDSGIGIEKRNIQDVFEIFRQVDSHHARQHGGSGLGLPLTKRLVELHDGRIVLESEPGIGTVVTVYLPGSRLIEVKAVA